jgi:hypothetical protein
MSHHEIMVRFKKLFGRECGYFQVQPVVNAGRNKLPSNVQLKPDRRSPSRGTYNFSN